MNEEIRLALSNIPSGATFTVKGEALPAHIIQWEAIKVEDISKDDAVNHSGMYWGSGRWETVEAKFRKVVKSTLTAYFDKKHEIWIFANKNLTVNQMQCGKAYSYGTVGRDYDWKGIFVFAWRVFQKYIPILRKKDFHDSKYDNYCTENVWETIVNYMELPFVKKDKGDIISPSREQQYFNTRKAYHEGWRLILHWNKGKFEKIAV